MLPPGTPRVPDRFVGPTGPMCSPFDDPPRHPAALWAIQDMSDALRARGELAAGVPVSALEASGGTMLGVLVVRDEGGAVGYLRAFAGEVFGKVLVPGWAPPLFDLMECTRRKVTAAQIHAQMEARWAAARPALEHDLEAAKSRVERAAKEAEEVREARQAARQARRAARATAHVDEAAALDAQAQHDNARFAERLRVTREGLEVARRDHARLKRRARAAGRLRRVVGLASLQWIQETYGVPAGDGTLRTLAEIFAPRRPPGGAGDCAGTKLVAWARILGLEPVALAETWWRDGGPGDLHAACAGRCGPLMPVLLEGVEVQAPVRRRSAPAPGLTILHEDEALIVVDKPAGLLSVPGRTEQDSVQTRLAARYPGLRAAHRLDEDTSGVLVLAKTQDSLRWVHAELAGRRVYKRYVAMLDGEVVGDEGEVELRLRADPSDRPRQVVDPAGKKACTHWQVLERSDGRTRMALEPRTGRTHQLRVHAAAGLGAPIVGDRLYGTAGERLLLHAERFELDAPDGGRWVFEAPAPF